ncbi:hypothetical protein AB9F35_35290, partial [Rhizobium leguminosarum]
MAETSGHSKDNLLQSLNRQIAQEPTLREQVREVVYFFNRLALCVNASLCSKKRLHSIIEEDCRCFLGAE